MADDHTVCAGGSLQLPSSSLARRISSSKAFRTPSEVEKNCAQTLDAPPDRLVTGLQTTANATSGRPDSDRRHHDLFTSDGDWSTRDRSLDESAACRAEDPLALTPTLGGAGEDVGMRPLRTCISPAATNAPRTRLTALTSAMGRRLLAGERNSGPDEWTSDGPSRVPAGLDGLDGLDGLAPGAVASVR